MEHRSKLNPDSPTGHGDAQEAAAVMAFAPGARQEGVARRKRRDAALGRVSRQVHINTVCFEGAPVKIIREIRDTVTTGGLGGLDIESSRPANGASP